jgi:hypothetical protein
MVNDRYLTAAKAQRLGRIMAERGGRFMGGACGARFLVAPTLAGWAVLDRVDDEDSAGDWAAHHWLWFAPTLEDVMAGISD